MYAPPRDLLSSRSRALPRQRLAQFLRAVLLSLCVGDTLLSLMGGHQVSVEGGHAVYITGTQRFVQGSLRELQISRSAVLPCSAATAPVHTHPTTYLSAWYPGLVARFHPCTHTTCCLRIDSAQLVQLVQGAASVHRTCCQ